MEQACPICTKSFPVRFLERHVNSCLDTLELPPPGAEADKSSEGPISDKKRNAFAALGLKADSRRGADKSKKESATLTSILLAEKRLKRRKEELKKEVSERIRAELQGTQSHPGNEKAEDATELREEVEVKEVEEKDVDVKDVDVKEAESKEVERAEASGVRDAPASQPSLLQFKREAELPLAHRLRPRTLDDFFGQEKLVGPNGILRSVLSSEKIPSFILWGVPGVGKTSLARIIAGMSNYKFVELSGAETNAKKLKEAFANAQNDTQNTILFLDEIHRFNKAVQDLLLPVIEKGVVTVIGATTENPSFTLNNALLSRMHTFVMEPLPHEALVKILNKGLLLVNRTRKILHGLHLIAMNKDAIDYIAKLSTGDSRVALNILELVNAYLSGLKFKAIAKTEPELEKMEIPEKVGVIKVTLDNLKPLLSARNFHQMYDKVGENHYDTISAFHKAVRGSDADAAVFYLVKMLSGGEDPLFIARRMIVIASEDVGLRDSSCLPFAISAMEALQFVGMPEGEIILAHCAVKLARAPKSTKSYRALRSAQALLKENPDIVKLPIPMHLRNAPTRLMKELGYGDTYKYNPSFKHGLIQQQFLPPEVKDLKLVEDTHLGQTEDDEVALEKYKEADAEEQEYKRFKMMRRSEVKKQMENYRKRSLRKNSLLSRTASDAAERLSSYDENLSKDDQPEYFDGTERDGYSEESDNNNNFDCSYDEFLGDD